jgi:anti-sigma factor RsiW
MNCEETIRRLADRDDGLLDPVAERALDEHLSACETCTSHAAEARALRGVLFDAEPVGAPPDDLRDRILAAAGSRPARRIPAFLRYAAAFLLGVAATLAVSPDRSPAEAPQREPPPAVAEVPEPDTPEAPRVPRRIR